MKLKKVGNFNEPKLPSINAFQRLGRSYKNDKRGYIMRIYAIKKFIFYEQQLSTAKYFLRTRFEKNKNN